VAIVQLQEFARAARVGKGKAASNVQPRKDASMELVLVLETACASQVGEVHFVIRQNASSALREIVLSQASAAVGLDGLGRGVTSVWPILAA